jgi:hypothetical protein
LRQQENNHEPPTRQIVENVRQEIGRHYSIMGKAYLTLKGMNDEEYRVGK